MMKAALAAQSSVGGLFGKLRLPSRCAQPLDGSIPSSVIGDTPTILIGIIFSLTLAVAPTGALSQEQSNPRAPFECAQPAKEQNAIIREAEKDHYTTRRVEFMGNRYTRDMVLRRRIAIGLQEGDFFTRRNLVRSLRNVSKLKMVHPVNVRDVELHLNRSEKTVDMIICFNEKERPSPKRAS